MKAVKFSTTLEPIRAAEQAGLRWVSDDRAGIRRVRAGKKFRYLDPHGAPVRDEKTLARIAGLAVPPAWTDVWICPSESGHLQATGRDARGRKQYRYHPRWRAERDATKYDKLVLFGTALPQIRARVERDLGRPGLPREKVLATVVRLLATTSIRIGNEEYARTNHSFGLTTFRDHHVDVHGAALRFQFRGKSGVIRTVAVHDRRLARIIRQCQELPGHELFQYIDEAGERRSVGSHDINDYLRAITAQEITAKDFRTWNGTVLAALTLSEAQRAGGRGPSKRVVVRCIEEVAGHLGNTVAVCRRCYVHPAVIEAYLDGTLAPALDERRSVNARGTPRLAPIEQAVLRFLSSRPWDPARARALHPGGAR